MSEFIYLNRLALRLIRFKFNRYVKQIIMNKEERIAQQVWDRIEEIELRKEVERKEGKTPREAEKILKARARAKAEAERLQKKFASKGWVKK